jgi:hypothetical protein
MKYSPYSIHSVSSLPYREIYDIQTPDGIDRYDLLYKAGAIFLPAKAVSPNQHTPLINLMLNEERGMSYKFDYIPSNDMYRRLYNFMRSACDSLSVQLTNVVEHGEDYSVVFYMRTSDSFSYIKIYINSNGFVTYAKPLSLIGVEDYELSALIEILNSNFI